MESHCKTVRNNNKNGTLLSRQNQYDEKIRQWLTKLKLFHHRNVSLLLIVAQPTSNTRHLAKQLCIYVSTRRLCNRPISLVTDCWYLKYHSIKTQ